MHELVGLSGYLFAPLTLLLLGLAARTWPSAGWLSILSFVTAASALVGLGGLMDPTAPQVGLYQRVLEASMLSWVVACALYLGAQKKTAAP